MTTMEMPIGQPEPAPPDHATLYDQGSGLMTCVGCKFEILPDDIFMRYPSNPLKGYCIRCFHRITDEGREPHLKKDLALDVERTANSA